MLLGAFSVDLMKRTSVELDKKLPREKQRSLKMWGRLSTRGLSQWLAKNICQDPKFYQQKHLNKNKHLAGVGTCVSTSTLVSSVVRASAPVEIENIDKLGIIAWIAWFESCSLIPQIFSVNPCDYSLGMVLLESSQLVMLNGRNFFGGGSWILGEQFRANKSCTCSYFILSLNIPTEIGS